MVEKGYKELNEAKEYFENIPRRNIKVRTFGVGYPEKTIKYVEYQDVEKLKNLYERAISKLIEEKSIQPDKNKKSLNQLIREWNETECEKLWERDIKSKKKEVSVYDQMAIYEPKKN
ncbi:hypothetical protein KAJ87_02690 [Candidatus Pacearchaeota archaeon]|nr:hypothetical protein [Candidatus Pacearchaeota archaeon]